MAQTALYPSQPLVGSVAEDASSTPAPLDYTTLDNSTLADLGKEALSRQLFHKAKTIFTLLHTREKSPQASYGLALALSQLGEDSAAFDTLGILHTRSDYWGEAAALWRGKTVLQLAEKAILNQNLRQAQSWLHTFAQDHTFHPDQDRYQRLLARLEAPSGTEPTANQQAFFRVGVLLPDEGMYSALGNNVLKAMQLALFREQTKDILLYPAASGETAEESLIGMRKLLKLGVDLVVGPLLSAQVDAVAPFARANRTPLITLSSDTHVAGPQTYLFNYLPEDQTRQVVRAAMNEDKTRFAALVPSTPYGYEVLATFKDEIAKVGGSLSSVSFFNPENADLSPALESLLQLDQAREELTKERQALEETYQLLAGAMPDDELARLKELQQAEPTGIVDFDALFVPVPAAQLPLVAAQLAFYDVDAQDVTLLGTTLWEDRGLLQNRAEYITGSLFASPSLNPDFAAAYQDAYGSSPHPLAILGYDAMLLAQEIAQEHARTQERIDTLLRREEGFAGYAGAYRLTEKGYVTRGYAIKRINRRAFKVVQPAPQLLAPPLPQPLYPEPASLRPYQKPHEPRWPSFW